MELLTHSVSSADTDHKERFLMTQIDLYHKYNSCCMSSDTMMNHYFHSNIALQWLDSHPYPPIPSFPSSLVTMKTPATASILSLHTHSATSSPASDTTEYCSSAHPSALCKCLPFNQIALILLTSSSSEHIAYANQSTHF